MLFLWLSAALAADVPLQALPSGLVTLEARSGDQTLPMLLDLGSSVTVLTREGRDALGLSDASPSYLRTVEAEAVGGTVSAELYRRLTFEVGDLSWVAPLVAVIDLASLQEQVGGTFSGILGADFLRRADLVLDRGAAAARVLPGRTFVPDEGWTRVKLSRKKGHLWVESRVDGRPFPALVDTGADATGLDPEVVAALGLALQPLEAAVLGADGRMIPLSVTSVNSLSIGETCLTAGRIQTSAEETTGRPGSVHLGVDRLFAQPIALSVGRKALFIAPRDCE